MVQGSLTPLVRGPRGAPSRRITSLRSSSSHTTTPVVWLMQVTPPMEVLVFSSGQRKLFLSQRASGQTSKGHEFALPSGVKYHISLLSPFPSQVSVSTFIEEREGGGEGRWRWPPLALMRLFTGAGVDTAAPDTTHLRT